MMPGIDGFETCRQMRSDTEIGEVKIVLVTAATTDRDREFGWQCGADDFVAKPFGLAEMKTRVDSIIFNLRGAAKNAASPAIKAVSSS
jgi:DNA-binding response OmpR family regulator